MRKKLPPKTTNQLIVLITFVVGIVLGTYLATNTTNRFLLNTFANTDVIFSDSFENPRSRIHYTVPSEIPIESVVFSQACEGVSSLVLQNETDDHRLVEKNFTPRPNVLAQVNIFDDLAHSGAYVTLKDRGGNQVTVTIEPGQPTYRLRLGHEKNLHEIDTGIPRTEGWHKIELASTTAGSYALIDNISTATTLPDGRSGVFTKKLQSPSTIVLGSFGNNSRACFSEVVLRSISPYENQ